MTTDEDSAVLTLMREALEKSRGHASYWEWKLDKRKPELHAAQVLSRFLFPDQNCAVSNVPNDPPDALLQLGGRRYGIEITEIVDQKAVERAAKRKQQGLPVEYDWANWDSNRLTDSITEAIATKDTKLSGCAEYFDGLLLALVTDESMIDTKLAADVARGLRTATRYINRAFIILSYDPSADVSIFPDRCPIFEIKVDRWDFTYSNSSRLNDMK